MSYGFLLPRVFPYMVTLTHDEVRHYVGAIMDFDKEFAPNGSSFAVTSDVYNMRDQEGTNVQCWNLWMSEASVQHLLTKKDLHLGVTVEAFLRREVDRRRYNREQHESGSFVHGPRSQPKSN